MANGIPQLLVPPVSTALNSLAILAEGLVWDFLTTDLKWGIYYAGTTDEVSLGQSTNILKQAQSVSGLNALNQGQLTKSDVYIDSVMAINQRKGSELSNYKLETGSFATFNKVEKPRQITIRLIKAGSEEDRGMFLKWLDKRAKSISTEVSTVNNYPNNLFDIYVPEVNYSNMTLIDYSVTRETKSGVTVIIADCVFQEVMQVAFTYQTGSTANSKNPDALPPEISSVSANTPSKTGLDKLKGLLG